MSNGLLTMLDLSREEVGRLRGEVDRLELRLVAADAMAAAVDALALRGWDGQSRLAARSILADSRLGYGDPTIEDEVVAVLQAWQSLEWIESEKPSKPPILAPWLSPPAALRDWAQGLWDHGLTGDDIKERVGDLVDAVVDSATAADREKWVRDQIDKAREGKPLIHANPR